MGVPAVRVDNLTRVYQPKGRRGGGGKIVALDSVDLQVWQGEVHGLLGPNGAGKTTLVKILSTILLPTSGHASVLGHDVVTETMVVRRRIGIVFSGDSGLYQRLTARQNLRYWAALQRVQGRAARNHVAALLDRVGLSKHADQRVETFSRGMKQRLHLARSLVGDPAVLFLDEPTNGLDPVAAHEFRRFVQELQRQDRSILLTTHDMAEAEAVCDRVTLIDRGRILATERPATLARLLAPYGAVEVTGADEATLAEVPSMAGVRQVTRLDGGVVRIETNDDETATRLVRRLAGTGFTSISTATPSLENAYLQVIGDRGLGV